MKPLVSVVMSVFNGDRYLSESLESILNQTYRNIEFIIINDGSLDLSLNIIKKYYKQDNRIKIIENNKNQGLIYSLNEGIKKSTGKYIVRMDADDVALPTKIEEQVKFMEANRQYAMSGTSHNIFLDGKGFINKNMNISTSYEEIMAKSIFECCFVHPSIIMRTEIIKNNKFYYKEEYKYAEDFGLWCEIIPKYKVSNINKPLLKYRIVKNSITRKANKDMRQREQVFKTIYKKYLNLLDYNITEQELDIHFEISMAQNICNFKYSLKKKENYLSKLILSINIKDIKKVCANEYFKCCIYQGNERIYRNSSFNEINQSNKIKFYKAFCLSKLKQIIKYFYK